MNFRTCKYFLTVCELGTINAAARKLFISQQSLSTSESWRRSWGCSYSIGTIPWC